MFSQCTVKTLLMNNKKYLQNNVGIFIYSFLKINNN